MQLIQKERLICLLQHAYKHVPYYRHEIRKNGVLGKNKIINIENFTHMPLLDKSIIRAFFDELKSDDLP